MAKVNSGDSTKSDTMKNTLSSEISPQAQIPSRVQPQAPTAMKRPFGQFIQKTLGFQRHEFVLWLLCSIALGSFVLFSAPLLHPPTFKGRSIPGEWHSFEKNPYYSIRNKAVYIHTYMGYVIMTLLTLGNAGALIITPITLGGNDLSQTALNLFLVVATSVSMYLAWYYIRRQQIDEHRKWILRAMSWMSVIVSVRVIMTIVTVIITVIGGYTSLWTCDEVLSVIQDTEALYEEFPSCRLGLQTYVGVPAGVDSPLHLGSALRLTFAMAGWLAISIHTSLTEIYIQLTPKEDKRLKNISYRKQLALGLLPAQSASRSNTEDTTPTSDKL
ncbi:hypothetical protein Clacol_002383 [Clathrus columnatus]|uniref:Uncharacterized protein n=1 Tax=Clathrus columnatus TaxID=1419009 RepID=A0AAV5A1N7_9AGAM|nr:hypothetical protein Clacol_002383 [Clathrus columnatus]